MIIDTHCHLDDSRFREDLGEVVERAKASGVEKMIIPGADPLSLKDAIEIAERFDGVYFAVGVHPNNSKSYFREFLEQFITHPKCVAVGECGLDYYRLSKNSAEREMEKSLQKEVFIDQIELARRYEKPLIVHIRDASRDSQEILEEFAEGMSGVLHCYNADHQLLSLSKKGFYFGIGGIITFKNARKLVEIYPKIAEDRIVIETDAPYLTPHPYRGKRNEPSYCRFVAEKMAKLSGVGVEEMETITTLNAKRLFGI